MDLIRYPNGFGMTMTNAYVMHFIWLLHRDILDLTMYAFTLMCIRLGPPIQTWIELDF